ncbi:3-oxoacyl-ACP reductase FabG [Aneurinibacillus sp. Ricciae_BoGa-3]|uniref:3-oxoacyl-ACP reductase FabG n=1 Tax=Aneurinibacillus sp. Ricciae_BoGa-3 TaxID=3022697 RepID=UPI0023407FEC|nr:3-oxoacyl-ACP reductase FabG [Aneurinibacillus sp. Ricciae_BoGa-3]WCK52595.1 3-oxoacyl-ACP reductase FabG [Aneurinibacillus sp. Ricciae_BoGa-3]
MTNTFKDKSVLITGASKGIGKGIARIFASHGAQVAVVARHMESAEECAAEIRNSGFNAKAFVGDVSNRTSMENLAQEVAETYGGIDVLCANAGIFPSASLEEMTGDDWDQVINTNARGTLFALQASLPYLKSAQYGRVIITSSITGPVSGYAGWSHYGASKAAQLGFMRSAALELAHNNITINAVMPGNILTEGLQGLGSDYLERMASSIPLKRLGSIEDIAHAALFLASKEAGYITGQTLIVDGGQTIPENLEAMG